MQQYKLENPVVEVKPDNHESGKNVADEIASFHALLEQGIITQEEFDIKKTQLLQKL
jgi:predicted Zn-dependent peptidase